VEGMLLEATGDGTLATGAVARRIGALRPECFAATAAGRRYPPMGIVGLAALEPAVGTM
jgi:hypothetical protein